MAKVAVPILKLRYNPEDAYSNAIMDVFEAAGAWSPMEDYTYTGRVSVNDPSDPETAQRRSAIAAGLRKILPADEAVRLIGLLDEHNWDVSFFVDSW